MKLVQVILALVLVTALCATVARAQPVDVAKTNSLKVYMHYMPWFDTPAVLGPGNWGYHWKMNNQNPNVVDASGKRQIASHYYPKIGPYQSSDPDVIEYHLLLMKLAGVDGVMIDWYGVEGTNGDINRLLSNSNALVDRVDDVGLEFGVVMEDRFSANIDQAKANVAYLRDNYFNKPGYIRLGAAEDPLVGVFGPITFQQPTQWTQILAEAGEDVDFLTLWYESQDAGSNADGEYAWIYEDENRDNHISHQSNFYQFRSPSLGFAGGVAYPGFDDFYVEGGVGDIIPFDIPHNGGQTLADVLNVVSQNTAKMDFVQLATFNDFGEGTMFEPTVETGFEYLKQIQEFTGAPYGEDELQLVYRLFLARKKYAGDAPIETQLDQVATLLAELEIDAAADLLHAAAPAGDYNADGDVDAHDYIVWRNAYDTATILYGSGADGNYDGTIDAADFTVWRDNLGAGESGSVALYIPEPASLRILLLGLTAAITWRRGADHRIRSARANCLSIRSRGGPARRG
jgi:Glycosyl hydrolase family 99